jgi:opacity protein-like surface antigen
MLPEPQIRLATPAPERGSAAEEEQLVLTPWSVNLRLQGIALEASPHHRDTGLGGLGASLRYALAPSVSLDLGFDSFSGSDYNGYDRSENSLSLSALLYLNPQRLVRTYLLGGLNASVAHVDVAGDGQEWAYVGAQAGLGLDFVVSQRVSLNVDMLGFLRGRTDSRAEREPEFNDGHGNLSNTSGGGLFRGGVSIYW